MLKVMEEEERAAFVEQEIARRKKIEAEMEKLNAEREKYIEQQLEKEGVEKTDNSFNGKLFKATQKQYSKKGMKSRRTRAAF